MRISPEEIEHYARQYRQLVAAGRAPQHTFEQWMRLQLTLKAQGEAA